MHFIPDSSEEDFALEMFWKEDHKKIFRNDVRSFIYTKLKMKNTFYNIFKSRYQKSYNQYSDFIEDLVEMVIIGAENGSDSGFDKIYTAFMQKKQLPKIYKYAVSVWPLIFTIETEKKLRKTIINEYKNEVSYKADYKEHYYSFYTTFEKFLDDVASIIINSSFLGAEDAKIRIFRAYITNLPILSHRRRPKRLKGW